MKILVTGSTGFLGQHLLKRLTNETNYELVVLLRKGPSLKNNKRIIRKINKNIKIVLADITVEKEVLAATKNIDCILHLAASVSSTDKETNYAVNVTGAKNLVNAVKKNAVKKIIFTSTFLAGKPSEQRCNYGSTKLEAENVFKEANIPLTMLRLCLVYGKGGKGFTKIVKNVKLFPFVIPLIGSGKYLRQPVFVDDVTSVIVQAIEKPTSKEIFYVGGPKTESFKNMILTIEKQLGLKKILVSIPVGICVIIAKVLERILKKSPITSRDIVSLNQNTKVDIGPTKKYFKYDPVTFEKGVELILKK